MTRNNARYSEPKGSEPLGNGHVQFPSLEAARYVGTLLGLPFQGAYLIVSGGVKLTGKLLKTLAQYGGEYKSYDNRE